MMGYTTTFPKGFTSLSPTHLRNYQAELGISGREIGLLRSFDPTAEILLRGYCNATVPKELLTLSRQFGYPILALRMETFDWELTCLIEGYENIAEMLIDFIERPGLQAHLSSAERLLITLYTGVTQTIQVDKQYQIG